MLTVPNCITSLRIFGAMGLLFLKPFTPEFYVVYTLCGVSDVLDGMIARATGKITELGAKLDSVADLVFYAAMLVEIIPSLWVKLPRWIWVGTAIVMGIRAFDYLLVAYRFHMIGSLHTYLNKLSGAGIFAFPYALALNWAKPVCITVFVISTVAAVENLAIHLCLKGEYRFDIHSIFQL